MTFSPCPSLRTGLRHPVPDEPQRDVDVPTVLCTCCRAAVVTTSAAVAVRWPARPTYRPLPESPWRRRRARTRGGVCRRRNPIGAAPQAAVIRGIAPGRRGPSRRLGVAFRLRHLRGDACGQNLKDPQRAMASVGKLHSHGIPGASPEQGAANRGSGRDLMASCVITAPPDEHELGYPT